jgi:ATP-dependent protease ClpP protease subunit
MNRKRVIEALQKRGVTFPADASNAVLNGLLLRSWLTIVDTATIPEYQGGDYDVEMTIHGQIGTDYYGDNGYSAKQFQDEIKPFADKKVLLNIHSPGGNIWDGFAIAEMVRGHGNMDTKVLGLAASVSDAIFQSGNERVMPKLSMRMAHNPSALFAVAGNAEQLEAQKPEYDKTINRLKKHGETLAKMYADRNSAGRSVADCQADMNKEEFMDGDESLALGYCDKLTDETPVTDRLDLSGLKNVPAQILNQFSRPAQGGTNNNNQQETNIVNKKQKIALLDQWGVKLPAGMTETTVTDAWLDDSIAKGKPAARIGREQNILILNGWGVAIPAAATDGELENLVAKGKPATATPANVVDLNNHPEILAIKRQNEKTRRDNLRNQINALASAAGGMKIPLNSVEAWVNRAYDAPDGAEGINSVIADLQKLESKPVGFPAVSEIVIGDKADLKEISRMVQSALAPRNAILSGRASTADAAVRRDISAGAKTISANLRKQIRHLRPNDPDTPVNNGFDPQRAAVIGEWLDSMNIVDDVQNGPYGSVTVSSDLQRQVIMSEAMRAFRRRLLPLMSFGHTFNDVPLQGNDEISVPYYPLYTTGSSRFVAPGAAGAAAGTTGYQFTGTDQAFRKLITVGGAGPAVKVAGQDRAYQALTYSAYLLRRQPWVDIQRLAVMRAEQLAFDILNDVVTAWVLPANFGNAVWSGLPAGFDDRTVAYLQGVADKADWPEAMRMLVIGTDYYTNLAQSPYVKAYLNIGDVQTIREGKIGGLYQFEDTIGNPRIPVTASGNLVGWIAYPSAVLVATSPILPGPGEMRLMVSYDLVVDDQIGLTFEYKYWGEPWNNVDREIIESNYGSGLGEQAALKRLVANGV